MLTANPTRAQIEPPLFSAFLRLENRRALVYGNGFETVRTGERLARAGAILRVVSSEPSPELREWIRKERHEFRSRRIRKRDLRGVYLVMAERYAPELEHLWQLAEAQSVFANVMDEKAWCSFYLGSVVERGALQIAISTSGIAPALAVRLRERFENELPVEVSDFLELARELRPAVMARHSTFSARKRVWYELVDSGIWEVLASGDRALAKSYAERILETRGALA